jgi:GTP:adenosylcobinamide-phosphate guanylyltransferase
MHKKKKTTIIKVNASKEINDHHQVQQTRRRQPSLGTINEKKEITITGVNTMKGNDHHQEQQIKKKKMTIFRVNTSKERYNHHQVQHKKRKK